MDRPNAGTVHKTTGQHGEVRGLNLTRRSPQFEGRFGRLFRALPPAHFEEDMLKDLARAMTASLDPPTPETEHDDEENRGISAGYTYFGQFIDHDLTFDPASSLERENDPDGLVDYRTPRFDLDCVYGRGPDDQPYLYRRNKSGSVRMLLGAPLTGNAKDPNARGLPRVTPEPGEPARAVIGDPRNDENVIVSQLQANMLRFHNRMSDVLGSAEIDEVQRMVRWHYQWVVLHDFLPTIIGEKTTREILSGIKPGDTGTSLYRPAKDAYIPVEFAVAAYRFGHSMVRPIYRLNAETPRLPIFSSNGDESLVGFRAFPSTWAIDWSLFFKMGDAPDLGPSRVQPAYKIDTSLVNPLGALPPSIAATVPSLTERNLIRGWRMQLPSGQAVARAIGADVLPEDALRVGKATEGDKKTNKRIAEISPRFANNAPLWYYVLAEAQSQMVTDETPIRLGPVGGRLVGEVFVGIMLADSHSYLRQNPEFTPHPELVGKDGAFRIADLLRNAMMA